MSEKVSCKDAKAVTAAAKAQDWANELVRREARGPGDTENAMRRLEARYGIPWRAFWTLRYRPPADILTGLFLRLNAAYRAECDRQMRILEHETEITKIIAGPDAPAVRSALALVHEDEAQNISQ